MSRNYSVGSATIRGVLDSKTRYVVPDYQRRYDWQEDKVMSLWEDLLVVYLDDLEYERQEYLLGPIVLLAKDNHMDIIDGQQRLVTLTLLFCAFRESLKPYLEKQDEKNHYIQQIIKDVEILINMNSNKIIDLNHANDDALFGQICSGEISNLKTRSKLVRNYQTILNLSEELCKKCEIDKPEKRQDGIDKLAHIIRELQDRISFVCMTVYNEDYSHQIFESLNSKGQKLKQADLIKSHILDTIPEKQQRTLMQDRWSKIMDGTNGKIKSDQLIYTSMLSRTGESDKDVAKRELYKEIKKQCKTENDVQKFVMNLEEDAKIFKNLVEPDMIPGIGKHHFFKHSLHGLNQLRAVYFKRPMMAACREWGFHDLKTRKLAECLVKFFFVYRTICKLDIDLLRRNSKIMTKQIINKEDLNHILWTLLKRDTPDGERNYVEPDMFIKKFPEHILDSQSEAKYIFTSFEHHLQKPRGLNVDDQNLNIEHIFPKNPSLDDWPNSDELKDHIDRLGNQTLLLGPWNSTLSNHGFEEKLQGIKTKNSIVGYQQSGLELNKRYLCTYTRWTVGDIKNREDDLTELAKEIWDLSEYLNNVEKPNNETN